MKVGEKASFWVKNRRALVLLEVICAVLLVLGAVAGGLSGFLAMLLTCVLLVGLFAVLAFLVMLPRALYNAVRQKSALPNAAAAKPSAPVPPRMSVYAENRLKTGAVGPSDTDQLSDLSSKNDANGQPHKLTRSEKKTRQTMARRAMKKAFSAEYVEEARTQAREENGRIRALAIEEKRRKGEISEAEHQRQLWAVLKHVCPLEEQPDEKARLEVDYQGNIIARAPKRKPKAGRVSRRKVMRAEKIAVGGRYSMAYMDYHGDITERDIIVRDLDTNAYGQEYIVATCLLRHQERTFRLDRVISLTDTETGEVIVG